MYSVEVGLDLERIGLEELNMRELTRFERARIIGARALQIAMGAPVLIKIEGVTDPIDIAEIELREGTIPITVRRR